MAILDLTKRPSILPKELKISDLVIHLCWAPVILGQNVRPSPTCWRWRLLRWSSCRVWGGCRAHVFCLSIIRGNASATSWIRNLQFKTKHAAPHPSLSSSLPGHAKNILLVIVQEVALAFAKGTNVDTVVNIATPPHTQRGCGIRQFGLRMTTQEEEHARLEGHHLDRLQPSSEVAVQLQQQFQERRPGLLLADCAGSFSQAYSRRLVHDGARATGKAQPPPMRPPMLARSIFSGLITRT